MPIPRNPRVGLSPPPCNRNTAPVEAATSEKVRRSIGSESVVLLKDPAGIRIPPEVKAKVVDGSIHTKNTVGKRDEIILFTKICTQSPLSRVLREQAACRSFRGCTEANYFSFSMVKSRSNRRRMRPTELEKKVEVGLNNF